VTLVCIIYINVNAHRPSARHVTETGLNSTFTHSSLRICFPIAVISVHVAHLCMLSSRCMLAIIAHI